MREITFRSHKYRQSLGFGIKFYRSYHKKELEAILLKFGKRGVWFFFGDAYKTWPSTNG